MSLTIRPISSDPFITTVVYSTAGLLQLINEQTNECLNLNDPLNKMARKMPGSPGKLMTLSM